MSKLTALRLLAEALVLAASRFLLNHLTLFHDRGEDQVIDFLRSIDHTLVRKLFAAEEERVAGFWTVRTQHHSTEILAQRWDQILNMLEKLSLSKEEVEHLRQAGFKPAEEKIAAFWKVGIPFRLEQRGRLDLAREYLGRMHHNARIVEQWAASQWFYQKRYGEDDEIAAGQLAIMRALRGKAKQFRMFALVNLIRIWLRCLVPFHETRFLPIPSVAALRRIFRYDLLSAYEEVKKQAIALGRLSREELAGELALKM